MARMPHVAAPGRIRPKSLVERDRELVVLADALRGLRLPEGRVVLVEAVAGQGKTALLEAARARAVADGIRTLDVRARHLEATAPYELLRRLLGPSVEWMGGPGSLTGPAAFAAPLFTPRATVGAGVDYGCQWLLTTLAADGPLLVTVDDAHWADVDSLRVLVELAMDLRHEPILIVVAARPTENPAIQATLARLATSGAAVLLQPAPLTEHGVREVLLDAFGRRPHDPFTRACARASGGNVFYLRELIRPLLAAGHLPDDATIAAVDAGGPDALVRTVRARLGELGDRATRLVVAAAVLGDGASLRNVATLAGLPQAQAGHEAARLAAAAILDSPDPATFVHPLIRTAVEGTAPPGVIGALHARAVDVLRAAGAPMGQVVQHVVAAPPTGSTETCRLLLAEAREDLAAGSAVVAHQLLTRALAEPPPPAVRPAVVLALAQAERAAGDLQHARVHLTEAAAGGPREVALAAMSDLFEVLYDLGDRAAAADLHRRALDAGPLGDTPEEIRLRAMLLALAAIGVGSSPGALADVDIDNVPVRSGEERHLLICAALHQRAARSGSEVDLVSYVRRAVQDLPADRPLTYWEVFAALEAVAFLAADEAMDEADLVLRRVLPDVARLRGVAPDLQAEWSHRTILHALRRGQFEEALAQLGSADEFANRHGLAIYTSLGNYVRGCVLLERGEYGAAGQLLLTGPVEEGVTAALGQLLSGRPGDALASLARFDHALDPDGPVRETEIQFEAHLIASHAHEALGDRKAALAEADRELAVRRRHGPPFRLGLALRRRATFAPTRHAVALLGEALHACRTTPRLPVRARVTASYGAALRRDGRLAEARVQLTDALDLTDRLGMIRLHERVTGELRGAGGRPRRTRVSGIEALTPSQRTVADLAARGRTNRQIAEELYVSVKTVETHLAAVYRKLGLASRDGLSAALNGG